MMTVTMMMMRRMMNVVRIMKIVRMMMMLVVLIMMDLSFPPFQPTRLMQPSAQNWTNTNAAHVRLYANTAIAHSINRK